PAAASSLRRRCRASRSGACRRCGTGSRTCDRCRVAVRAPGLLVCGSCLLLSLEPLSEVGFAPFLERHPLVGAESTPVEPLGFVDASAPVHLADALLLAAPPLVVLPLGCARLV